MLVLDTFLFNGEQIAELRMKYLYNHVDKFIIVESWYTHTGIKKDVLYYNKMINIFKPFAEKITFLEIREFPTPSQEWIENQVKDYMHEFSVDAWFRENYQRDFVCDYLITNVKDPYILLVCDVDEIPFVHTLDVMKRSYDDIYTPVYMEMDMFYYSFRWKKKYKWHLAFAVTDKCINASTSFSNMRTSHDKAYVVTDAGVHCSYFFNIENIERKLKSFAHCEFSGDEYTDKIHIQECLNTGADLFRRGEHEDCLDMIGTQDEYTPTHVLRHTWHNLQNKL
jgi:beta-1,4-mannosyl-glycoprotein beta-1,4-N-acetylglucosaminyltransferase